MMLHRRNYTVSGFIIVHSFYEMVISSAIEIPDVAQSLFFSQIRLNKNHQLGDIQSDIFILNLIEIICLQIVQISSRYFAIKMTDAPIISLSIGGMRAINASVNPK
jgi:hypothetical protein